LLAAQVGLYSWIIEGNKVSDREELLQRRAGKCLSTRDWRAEDRSVEIYGLLWLPYHHCVAIRSGPSFDEEPGAWLLVSCVRAGTAPLADADGQTYGRLRMAGHQPCVIHGVGVTFLAYETPDSHAFLAAVRTVDCLDFFVQFQRVHEQDSTTKSCVTSLDRQLSRELFPICD
jgi:hypothetical protein